MKATRRKPCPNCPFRKDAKLAHWHPSEYLMLQRIARTEHDPFRSKPFGCHKDKDAEPAERELCVGWLIHQRERGTPSIALRLILMRSQEAALQYEKSEPDGELFDSIDELVKMNIERDKKLNPERYEGEP